MKTNTKNLVHINEASKLLGLTEKELNDLVEGKKIPHVVSSMTKMIKQSTIDEILPNYCGIKQSDTFVFGAMHISGDLYQDYYPKDIHSIYK